MVTCALSASLYYSADGRDHPADKRGGRAGSRWQYDMSHKDGSVAYEPYGSADTRMARVRDDIGRG